jgi:hypothetical protein
LYSIKPKITYNEAYSANYAKLVTDETNKLRAKTEGLESLTMRAQINTNIYKYC